MPPERYTARRKYGRCVDAYGGSRDDVRTVARTSIEASFAAPETKAQLLTAVRPDDYFIIS